MKFKNVLGILIAVSLIVAISGCTSTSVNLTKEFKNQYMSFQYPDEWTPVESNSGYTVALAGSDGQITINNYASKTSYQSYIEGIASTDKYRGQFTENNTQYKLYYYAPTDDNTYAFAKNGKYFTIDGPTPQNQTMISIIETIQ